MLIPLLQGTKIDDMLSVILEQLYIESNLYRKAMLLKSLKNIIEMHGVHCVKQKKIKQIFIDSLDICCNGAVAEILLNDVIEVKFLILLNYRSNLIISKLKIYSDIIFRDL